MKEAKAQIKYCLMSLSMDPTHNGYEQLLECILMRLSQNMSISEMYRKIAKRYGVKEKTVMRNVSYALGKVENLNEKLSKMMGFRVPSEGLHIGRIVSYLAEYVSRMVSGVSA